MDLRPFPVETLSNPDQDTLRRLALEHTPAVSLTSCGNLVKVARNKARQAKYTYIITDDDPAGYSHKTLSVADAQPLIDAQAAYIAEQGKMIEVQRWVGVGPRAVAVQWLYTLEGANIAGMQSILSFPRERVESGDTSDPLTFPAQFQIIYTPNFFPDVPGGQRILVDLANYRTYIMGPDYFGESKKAALRMLNHLVFAQGGLVLHAGAKGVTLEGGRHVSMTIMGLSGTGKTTTTFSKQGSVTQPIQDDMVALWPGGEMSVTENGCFAKTWALTEDSEPVIYRGTVSADAWVENVYTDADGNFDFFKEALTPDEVARLRDVLISTGAPADNVDRYVSGQVALDQVLDANGVPDDGWDFVKWTANGRSIIPMSSVEDAADLDAIDKVEFMGILNRDEGADACTPGVISFVDPKQAAGFFMLGETTKTSAAGKERGKTRSPFTQPFFPQAHGLQAVRFSELAATMPHVELWMMNTGFVGGDKASVAKGHGYKVKIRHSSAMLQALLTHTIVWTTDPDFGYRVVDVDHPDNAALIEAVPAEILQPRRFYARTGQLDVYNAWVSAMKAGRRAFLESYSVDPAIVAATNNEQ
jgi:phosphoenolpyruvate carboxykinase (ATP)